MCRVTEPEHRSPLPRKRRLFVAGNFQLDQAYKVLLQKKAKQSRGKPKPTPHQPATMDSGRVTHLHTIASGAGLAENVVVCAWLHISPCSEHLTTCNVHIKDDGVRRKTLQNSTGAWLTQLHNWPWKQTNEQARPVLEKCLFVSLILVIQSDQSTANKVTDLCNKILTALVYCFHKVM